MKFRMIAWALGLSIGMLVGNLGKSERFQDWAPYHIKQAWAAVQKDCPEMSRMVWEIKVDQECPDYAISCVVAPYADTIHLNAPYFYEFNQQLWEGYFKHEMRHIEQINQGLWGSPLDDAVSNFWTEEDASALEFGRPCH